MNNIFQGYPIPRVEWFGLDELMNNIFQGSPIPRVEWFGLDELRSDNNIDLSIRDNIL